MLEHAKADNLASFLLRLKEYNIDLLRSDSRNMSGSTALHVATANGAMQVVNYLVTKMCVDVNAVDNWNRTPLDEVGYLSMATCFTQSSSC